MAKLEPQIIDYLNKNGSTHINTIVSHFNSKLSIEKEKISFRVNKLVSQGKFSSDNGVISIKKECDFIPDDLDEEYNYGPIKLGRKGKQTFIQSNWKEGEYDRHMELIKENLPKLKNDVKQKINHIEKEILDKFDPLDALAYVSYKNLTCIPETYTESSFEGKQLFPEIIQNIILKNNSDKYKKETNRENIPDIEKYLEELFPDLMWSIGYEIGINDKITNIEKQILMKLLSRALVLRGDAYPRHYKEVACELFDRIKDKLEEKGFTIEQYYETIEEIERQINYNYNEPIKKMRDEHNRFIEFCNSEEEKGANFQDIFENYQKDLDTRRAKLQPDIEKLSEIALKGSYEITINKKINQSILDYLSLELGTNDSWTHPLDGSEINIKPIIRLNSKYYCFIIPNLIRNVIDIIENILTEEDKTKINYSKKKGDYFEEKVINLFRDKLKSGSIYPKLFYNYQDMGETKRCEIDCVIVYQENLFLVEVKGKTKRDFGGRKDVLTIIEGDLKKNISQAFEQTKRAFDYIQKNEKPIFENNKGQQALKIEKKKIKNIFLLNITSESFQTFSTDLNSLKLFREKLLDGNIYPYVINIYDLMVLMDLIEEQDFIDFILQRIDVSKNYELKSGDELDFIGYYLANGSLSKTEDIEKLQSPLIHGYSEDIDRWYAYLSGEVEKADKPVKKK